MFQLPQLIASASRQRLATMALLIVTVHVGDQAALPAQDISTEKTTKEAATKPAQLKSVPLTKSGVAPERKFKSREEVVEALKKNPREAIHVLQLAREYREANISCLDVALGTCVENGDVAKEAASHLRALMTGSDKDARRIAAIALARVGQHDERVIAALIEGSKNGPWFNGLGGRGATKELAAIGKPALPALMKARAITVLGHLGRDAEKAIPLVLESLRDDDTRQSIAAAVAIYRITDDERLALPVLTKGLSHSDWRVRLQAVRGLIQLGPAAASAQEAVSFLQVDEKDLVRGDANQMMADLRSLKTFSYDAAKGTLPTEQGFQSTHQSHGGTAPKVVDGVLHCGPTTERGISEWNAHPFPLDCGPTGKGMAMEWIAQVNSTGNLFRYTVVPETGFTIRFTDMESRRFYVLLGEDLIFLGTKTNPKLGTPRLFEYSSCQVKTTDRFHYNRLVVVGGEVRLLVDGKEVLRRPVSQPGKTQPNTVHFGDGATAEGSDVLLKNLWYANDARAKSPFYPRLKPLTQLTFNAGLGSLPEDQGFMLIDDRSGHGELILEDGVLIDGPTTRKGARYWKSQRIPLDFRPEGNGLAAEWKVQIINSDVDSTGRSSGWSAGFVDQFGHQFVVGLGNERIVLNNKTGDRKPTFARFKTTDGEHHYRFVVDDNQGTLFVDGKLLVSKPIGVPDKRKVLTNRVLFGDGTGNASAHAKLRAFAYASDAAAKFRFPQSLHYDASRGTLPSEQGFRLLDSDLNNALPRVENGVLLHGPTTTEGSQTWNSKRIPLDFRPESGEGLCAEWTVQIVNSEIWHEGDGRHYAGWSAMFIDSHGHAFKVSLTEHQVAVHAHPDKQPVIAKFRTTDTLHHYRFVVDDGQGTLFIDGKSVLSRALADPAMRKERANHVYFGDGTSKAGGQAKLKAFFYSNDPGAKSLPSGAAQRALKSSRGKVKERGADPGRSADAVSSLNRSVLKSQDCGPFSLMQLLFALRQFV